MRPCSHCRLYQYNESKGEVTVGRDGKPMKRLGKVPCDSSLGCPKGHYSSPKHRDLTAQEESLLSLFYAVKATGGAVLNEDERSDECLAVLFSHLERINQARSSRDSATALANCLVQLRGAGK